MELAKQHAQLTTSAGLDDAIAKLVGGSHV